MTKFHCLRLKPNDDLKLALVDFCELHQIVAAAIISCVGSLSKLHLRLASAQDFLLRSELYEIVSLVGTLSINGVHLHISAADSTGAVIGGHLMESNLIHTTAEIIIVEFADVVFERKFDTATGYKELVICSSNNIKNI